MYTVKPTNPFIEWGNPISKDIVWASTPASQSRNEFVKKGTATLLTSGAWDGINGMGAALSSTSTTNGGAYWPWSTQIERITNQFSIVMFINPTTIIDNSHFFCLPYNSTWSSPFDCISFQNSSPDTSKIQLQYAVSGSLNGDTTAGTGYLSSGMGLTMIGAAHTGSATRFYKNGIFLESVAAANSGNVDFGNKVEVDVFNRVHGDAGEGTAGTTNYCVLWSRKLTDNEMTSLYLDPWQIYRAPKLPRLNSVAAATTFQATFMMLGMGM